MGLKLPSIGQVLDPAGVVTGDGMYDPTGLNSGEAWYDVLLDPLNLGIYDEGGIFGDETQSPSEQAQADFLRRMIGREGELYPLLQQMLSQSGSAADRAYAAKTGEANRLYPGVQDALTTGNLNPETLSALLAIKQDRLGSIDGSVDSLIKSKIADFGQRGMMSDSTVAGAGREADRAMAPLVNQAEGDYQKSLMTMPGDLSSKQYALGVSHGDIQANAESQKYKNSLNTYLNMWKNAAGLGATAPAQNSQADNTAALGALASVAGSFAPKAKAKEEQSN